MCYGHISHHFLLISIKVFDSHSMMVRGRWMFFSLFSKCVLHFHAKVELFRSIKLLSYIFKMIHAIHVMRV